MHYAYHPCDDAVLSLHELAGRNWRPQETQRLLMDEIPSGVDELGVLLMGHAARRLSGTARSSRSRRRGQLAPFNSATSLQVAAGVLGGMVWAIENPTAGLLEADELDHRPRPRGGAALSRARSSAPTRDWTPLEGRGGLFPEDLDPSDPWQFKNVRVA